MPIRLYRNEEDENRSINNLTNDVRYYMNPPGRAWNEEAQQAAFNSAVELVRRGNTVPTNQINLAREVLRRLARNYNRTWTYNWSSNGNSNSPPPAAVQAPNYSKASAAVKKWLSTRPHTVHMNVVNIKLSANAKDPVSYHDFEPGNGAVMVIKKYLQKNGAMRSKRTFYEKNVIERLAGGKKWRTILRMKGSDPVFKDPLNRRTVYRRDLMNVKFVA
jgi:hypothetical protein